MNPKQIIPLAVVIGAAVLAVGIFIGRSTAPGTTPNKPTEQNPVETPQAPARSAFAKRLARVEPRTSKRPVPSAPLATAKRANVLAERIPHFSLAPVVVERDQANHIEPIKIPAPQPVAIEDTYPVPLDQAGDEQVQIEFEVQPVSATPFRQVRLPTPVGNEKPFEENGEILRHRRPVREAAEQGQSFDFPTAEVRTVPGAEPAKKLAKFSAKEWSARRNLSPVEIGETARDRPGPDSFTGVLPANRSRRKSPESSSSIPKLNLLAQDRPAPTLESLPEIALKDQFASVRLPAPRPMTQTPSLPRKQLDEVADDSSLSRDESFALKAAVLSTRPGKGFSKSKYPERSSQKLIVSPLPPARQPEPLPKLKVLTAWPRLSTHETNVQHAEVHYPLPGLHPPLKLRAFEGPAESSVQPKLPVRPKQKLE